MNTRETARILKLTGLLMELHEENEFKSKAISNAAFRLGKSGLELDSLTLAELEKVPGIGKSIAAKIFEIRETGTLKDLEAFISRTPSGIVEMLSLKGIGPKKVSALWKGLGIESLIELLYACNENRLVALTGFGAKTQEQVKASVEFALGNTGKFHFSAAEPLALQLVAILAGSYGDELVSLTGAMRRKCEVIEVVEILVGTSNSSAILGHFDHVLVSGIIQGEVQLEFIFMSRIRVKIFFCNPDEYIKRLFETTGSAEHLSLAGFTTQPEIASKKLTDETSVYTALSLPFIIPEMREGLKEIEISKRVNSADIIQLNDLRGVLHNHSTYSDGLNTLSEMAERCRDDGFEYLGICDHSQSAGYAGGLKPDRVLQQQEEIDQLNSKYKDFRIFKGIESDILGDGSLDYDEEILASFDFVVASIHSNLKMDIGKATARLITAIENPFTTILGHPTGRLLLARQGYPIDYEAVINACADNDVVIELNSHPYRLDLDWRWIDYAVNKGVLISINPDAHSVNGLSDMRYGVNAARKAGLIPSMCFNTKSLVDMDRYFYERRKSVIGG